MLVRDVMTVGVVTAAPEASLRDTARLFIQHGISGAPVVDDAGRIVGMVTKTDLLRENGQGSRPVREVMTREVISLTEQMTVAEAARILVHHQIRRAPVLRTGTIVGIVGQIDLLRPHVRTDEEILSDIEHGVLIGALGLSPRFLVTRVLDGVVFLEGPVRSEQQHASLRRLVCAVPGVIDLVDHVLVAPMAVTRLEAGRSDALSDRAAR